MLFDFLYPVLWIGIGIMGFGFVARRWEKKVRKAFLAAQASADQKAEQLNTRLTHVEDMLLERLALAQASASASQAQLRSQLALRDSEREAATAVQTCQLIDQMAKQFTRVEQDALDRHALLGVHMAQLHAEATSKSAAQVQQLETALSERLAQARAASSASDAQLRSQLAIRHAEMLALTTQLTQQQVLGEQAALSRDAQWRTLLDQHTTQLESKLSAGTLHLAQRLSEQDARLAIVADSRFSIEQRRRMDRLQNDLHFVKNHQSSYLGDGTGLTHLVDETPIYINTNDFGCPSNFINGGRYEEEYYQVLASFRKPDSVFLDIGANLGVFSLRLAPLLRKGQIYAFEPNNQIHELFARSIHLNGLKDRINLFALGASDQNAELALAVPEGHAGGASVYPIDADYAGPKIEVRRIDDLLTDVAHFDLAKIDVEGHELHALRGMDKLLCRSPGAVILFEKLNANSGIEGPLIELFAKYEMLVYRIDGLTLLEVNLPQFSSSGAYFLATRATTVAGEFCRNFITVRPDDLRAIACRVTDGSLLADTELPPDSLIFHGPYWYLPRGSYRLAILGEIEAGFTLVVAEKFGYSIAEFAVSSDRHDFDLIVENDLTHFELIGRCGQGPVRFSIAGIRLTRLG
jgi:FkbM family methyltransferase